MRCVIFPTSSNQKTGNVIQSYSPASTCPARCPFKKAGCYGESYHTARQWARADKAEDPRAVNGAAGVAAALISAAAKRPEGVILFRHNVAGDIARPGTSEIDADALSELSNGVDKANEALRVIGRSVLAYTYTHCEITEESADAVRAAHIVVNVSCETPKECTAAVSRGLPAVMSCVDPAAAKAALKAKGLKAVQCPAQLHDGINCEKCRLCARRNRAAVVLFAVHGNGAKKAARAISIKAAKEV